MADNRFADMTSDQIRSTMDDIQRDLRHWSGPFIPDLGLSSAEDELRSRGEWVGDDDR